MKRVIISAMLATTAWAGFAAQAQEATRPLVLLFETSVGAGADKQLAASTTRALRRYLRGTQRVEITIFSRESPTVVRAIMEKKLTPDKVASYSSQAERIEVAKALGFHYAAGGEVSVKDARVRARGETVLEVRDAAEPDQGRTSAEKPVAGAPYKESDRETLVRIVETRLWVARADGRKPASWEEIGSATVSGEREMDVDNAMQSAASSAVLRIARRAFAALPRVSEPAPATGRESTALGAAEPPQPAQSTAGEHASKADENLKAGNLALAIEQYQRAVNADPTNGLLRLRLAEAYARKGLFDRADDEIARAETAGADAGLVEQAKQLVERIREQQENSGGEPAPESGAVPKKTTPTKASRSSAAAKIKEGDRLWDENSLDEAADAYKEAIRLNPQDPVGHERLAVVNASMSLFGESRKALDELKKVQPDPPIATVENRYLMLRNAFDAHFAALMKQYDSIGADFETRRITRESYYNAVRGLAMRLETMARFLDALQAPAVKQPALLRLGLACGLMAQAASSLLDYLESNSDKAKSNASVFSAQARKELAEAEKLDTNAVVIAK